MFNIKLNMLFFYFSSVSVFLWLLIVSCSILPISLLLIILTAYLMIICVLLSYYTIKSNINLFLILLFCLFIIITGIFITENLLLFYILFEASLIPMFLLVIGWGSRQEKTRAAYYLFFYTFISSILMLFSIIKFYILVGSINMDIAYITGVPVYFQKWGFICMFIAFSVKVPMIPFHIWLPQAHVEAPLAGSILLAGIMLKLGVYGFIRFAIPLYPQSTYYYAPLLLFLSIISIVYGGFSTIRQSDMKRLIAYSSVAHMGFATYALFTPKYSEYGIVGCYLILIAHGLVSPALFIVVGILYERYHTRVIKYYGGLSHLMPKLTVFAFLFTLSSMAFPGTLNFLGEFYVIVVAINYSYGHAILISVGCFVGLIYSLYFYQRIFTGSISCYLIKGKDLNKVEFISLLMLMFPVIILGIYPFNLITYISSPIISNV